MTMDSENSGIGATMLVGPTGVGSYPYPVYTNGGNGGFGSGSDWWGILLLIALMNGGFGGWGMGGFGGMMGMGFDFPWLMAGQQNISNNTNDGFRDAQLHDSITSVGDRLASLSTQLCDCCGQTQMSIANSTAGIQQSLCNGFARTTAAITGAQNAISNQLYSNELASLNRSFAEQTANTAGFNGVQSSLCDIRYGNATNTRDIIESQTRGTQAILDKLCALELDGYKRENDNLRTQLNMADLRASQTAQTATIQAGQRALANEVEQYVLPTPRPAYIVQNPNCCTSFNGCGCGGNGFVN